MEEQDSEKLNKGINNIIVVVMMCHMVKKVKIIENIIVILLTMGHVKKKMISKGRYGKLKPYHCCYWGTRYYGCYENLSLDKTFIAKTFFVAKLKETRKITMLKLRKRRSAQRRDLDNEVLVKKVKWFYYIWFRKQLIFSHMSYNESHYNMVSDWDRKQANM